MRKLVLSIWLILIAILFATFCYAEIKSSNAKDTMNDIVDYDESCTTFIAVGDGTPYGATIVGRNSDSSTVPYWTQVRIEENMETGIRYMGLLQSGDTLDLYFLNSEGVGIQTNARSSNKKWKGDFEKTLYGKEGLRVLSESSSAEEAIAIAEEIADKHAVRVPGGGSRTIFDKKEVYLIEGFGEDAYSIHGPWRNTVKAHANFVLDPDLRKHEPYPNGLPRKQRAEELLNKRGMYAKETSHRPKGQITPPYMFSINRDAEYRDPNHGGFDQSYAWDDRNIARLSYKGMSRYGVVIEIPSSNEDFLSVMWATPGFPPFCPFLPFYNGVSEVPPAIGSQSTNKTEVFYNLLIDLTYNPKYQEEVQRFWEAFEFETLRETDYLYRDVRKQIKDGDEDAAEELLYSFTKKRVDLAIDYAEEWRKVINEDMEVSIMEDGK